MSDSSGVQPQKTQPPNDPTSLPAQQAQDDEIPVEDLIRLTRELTQRITNLDRQRLALQLKGTRRNITTNAPITLQQFFTGEIDLDTELAKRFANAPLLSDIRLNPRRPASMLPSRRAVALLSTQDNAAQMTFDLDIKSGALETTFTLNSMLAFRFNIGEISDNERQRWLDLMRRQSGIAFLWTSERWEQDYIIFVVRENFARLYAFSPKRFEAAARITPDVLVELLDWLEAFWFPEQAVQIKPPEEAPPAIPGASVQGDYLSLGGGQQAAPSEIAEATEDTATTPEDLPGDDEISDPSAFEW